MKRAISRTSILLMIAVMIFAGLHGCKKTTASGSQQEGSAGRAAGTERQKASAPAVPTQEPVKDWYNKDDKEFTLTTAGQLAGLAKLVKSGERFKGKTIILGADIDLGGYHAKSKFNEGKGWVPIGGKRAMFKGTFEGNGRTIRGLYINDPMLFYAGLFGRIDSATVKSVNVVDVNITAHSRAGAIAGGAGNSTVLNSRGSGQINAGAYVGGVLGYARRRSNISECSSNANVNGNNYIGGIVGEVDGASRVTKCHSANNVTGELAVGGIAGGVKDRGSIVSNCYSSAKVTTGSKGGGIAGHVHQGASVRNCYSIGEVSGRTFVGGIVGQAGLEGQGEQPAAKTKAKQPAKQTARPAARQTAQAAPVLDTLSNNVALNPSVKATVGVASRVQGHNNSRLTMIRNIAFAGITNYAGNTEWAAKTERGRDGLDITKEQIIADGTIGGRFKTENGWIVQDGRLPGLTETVPVPSHLR